MSAYMTTVHIARTDFASAILFRWHINSASCLVVGSLEFESAFAAMSKPGCPDGKVVQGTKSTGEEVATSHQRHVVGLSAILGPRYWLLRNAAVNFCSSSLLLRSAYTAALCQFIQPHHDADNNSPKHCTIEWIAALEKPAAILYPIRSCSYLIHFSM